MDAPTNDATILILGHSLWADTTQPSQPGYGLAVSVVAVTGQDQASIRERVAAATADLWQA